MPDSNPKTDFEISEAYLEAQRLLQDTKKGYILYDQIFTTIETVLQSFHKLINGELLALMGNCFYWRQQPGEPLIFYGKNDYDPKIKGLGAIEICRFRLPDAWIGAGIARIDWPQTNDNDDKTSFLIS